MKLGAAAAAARLKRQVLQAALVEKTAEAVLKLVADMMVAAALETVLEMKLVLVVVDAPLSDAA